MARASDSRGPQVLFVLPAGRLAALQAAARRPLGPLAEPEPMAPETQPPFGPSYGPGSKKRRRPRGFFLDRYVY